MDGTIWHRARMFTLRVVVLPFPFLGPAIFANYLQHEKICPKFILFGTSHLFQPRLLVCCGCYFILSFYISFLTTKSSKANHPCLVCKRVKPKTLICRDVLPKHILNHLRFQPLILVECWRAFIRCFLKLFTFPIIVLPSACTVSTIFFLRLSVFVIFLFAIPFATVTLVIAMLLAVVGLIGYKYPLVTLFDKTHGRPCGCLL